MSTPLNVTLIGHGAISKAIIAKLADHPRLRISHVVVRESKIASTQAELPASCTATSRLPVRRSVTSALIGASNFFELAVAAAILGPTVGKILFSDFALSAEGLALLAAPRRYLSEPAEKFVKRIGRIDAGGRRCGNIANVVHPGSARRQAV